MAGTFIFATGCRQGAQRDSGEHGHRACDLLDRGLVPECGPAQFAADLPAEQATLMAVTQRPVTEVALFEPSGDHPLWRSVPSWFIFGELDRNIPAGTHRLMAERAGAKRTVEIAGASHVVGVSHPFQTAQLVLEAAGTHAVART